MANYRIVGKLSAGLGRGIGAIDVRIVRKHLGLAVIGIVEGGAITGQVLDNSHAYSTPLGGMNHDIVYISLDRML